MAEDLLEGFISAAAAIESNSREVFRLYVRRQRETRRLRWLLHRAEERAIPVERPDDETLAELAEGRSHGGVLARVGPRRFVALEALVADEPRPFVVMLDGIEDPYNFGQAVRALYAAGVAGVVVRPRNWLTAAAVVARASAGASERMPMAVAESAEAAADFYRQRGLIVAGAARDTAVSLYEADLQQAVFLLIGGEKRGVTRSFLQNADLRLAIPYERAFRYSLGAAASAAIVGFEMMRQRQVAEKK